MFRKNLRYAISCIPLLLFIVSYYFIVNYNEYGALNVVLSKRLSYMGEFFSQFTLANFFIGKPATTPTDCAYFTLLTNGGILWVIFSIITIEYAIMKNYSKINKYLPIIISTLISGIGENTFISPVGSSIIFWYIILIIGNPQLFANTNLELRGNIRKYIV